MFRVGTFCPPYLQVLVVAGPSAAFQLNGSTRFGKILCALSFAVDVAVYEYSSLLLVGGVERLAAVQCEAAMPVDACSA